MESLPTFTQKGTIKLAFSVGIDPTSTPSLAPLVGLMVGLEKCNAQMYQGVFALVGSHKKNVGQI